MSTRVGNASLMRRMRGAHQSSGLSEMSSQFHDECNAAPGRFFIDTDASSGDVRLNLAFAPTTFTTGCKPMVFVTTPPQPASKARRMLFSDSVGGADESRKGFSKRMPVNVTARLAIGEPPQLIQLVPASLFHLVVIFLACVQSSIEPRPVMSPTPNLESFQPPNENGSRGTGTPTFTPTMPALARSMTYRAVPPLSVNTDAAFP